MADKKWRLGYGDEGKILSAIEAGVLDGADLIVTKDTRRFAFVRPSDKSVLFGKSKLETFDSIEEANTYAASDKSAYAGELISVLVNDKYKTYRLQSAGSGYEIEDIESNSSIKQYVQVVDELPESDQEEGVIYIVGTTGSIWTGSGWKTVFEDVSTVEDRLKDYVDSVISKLASPVPEIVDEDNPLPETDYKAGQSWRVAFAGVYAGQKCEIGDLIICVTDYSADTASDNDFIVVQANIDGAVTGAESSEDGEIVLFSGVSGKVLKNSGINIDALTDSIKKSHDHANKEQLDSFTKTQDEILKDVDDKVKALKLEIDDRLIHKEPYIGDKELVTNGCGVVIEKVDDNTNKATYYISGIQKSIEFPADYSVVGGAINDNCHSSSIVINSGKLKIVHGGSEGDGDVAESNIVVNGGTIYSIYGGGYPDLKETGKANHTGRATIVVNNTDSKISVYGGGYSYASVGETNIIINGGQVDYLTSGGSNGFTANGNIKIHDGDINVVQSVNRGLVGASDITIDGGEIKAVYAGVEPDDGEVMTTATGTFGHSALHLLGGIIEKLAAGANNSVKDFDVTGFVSGEYCDGVLTDSTQATALGLVLIDKAGGSKEAIDAAKAEAIRTSKEYTDSIMTLTEF